VYASGAPAGDVLTRAAALRARSALGSCAIALVAVGCGADSEPASEPPKPVTPAPAGAPYEQLSEWHLFTDAPAQQPTDGVIPYEVSASLFADYANKHRFLWLPPGTTVGYDEEAKWRFPVGTILVKTFAYALDARDPALGERLIETRLLIHETEQTWTAHTYVWDDAQAAAVRTVAGKTVDVTWIDQAGTERHNQYGVPNTNLCQDCHGKQTQMDTLGGRTRQMNRDHDYGSGPVNQVDHLFDLGLLDAAPKPAAERTTLADPFGSAPLVDRTRAYLDANCGHCHSEGGFASSSGFWVGYEWTDPVAGNPAHWGVCKAPTSATGATCGLSRDVVPGDPDNSILICRVASEDLQVRMPPDESKIADAEGVALMHDWIASLTPPGCP